MGTFDALKKIDLHCHLDGSLSVETMRVLAKNIGRELPGDEELTKKMQVSGDCRNLGEYLSCFDLPIPFLCTEQNFEDAVTGVMRDAAEENIAYIEIRFSPLQSKDFGMTYYQMIEAAVRGLRKGTETYDVYGNLILCGMRHLAPEENIRMLKVGREFLGIGVCAADMAGNEAAFPIMLQREFFEEAKRLDMPFTIHAGECGSVQSIRDALQLGASRIGHGIAAAKDDMLVQELKKKHIPLEMCPISNLQTKAVESATQYPFEFFRKSGLMITINTDNRMVSGTSITREFEWLENMYGLNELDAQILTNQALDAAFADDDTKETVWKKLKKLN